ncbi:MAG: hypothetical protein GY820_32240 [Gammaproteobacteria bacterium]|nr:hypothetical protein [Gammaproteobacteria bacterium]
MLENLLETLTPREFSWTDVAGCDIGGQASVSQPVADPGGGDDCAAAPPPLAQNKKKFGRFLTANSRNLNTKCEKFSRYARFIEYFI